MGRLEQILDAVIDQIEAALTAQAAINSWPATWKAQVYQGWPQGPDLAEVVAAKGGAVTLYPNGVGKRLPPRGMYHESTTINSSPLLVSVAGSVITFSGSVTAGLNVFAYIGHPILGRQLVYYKTLAGDTPTSVAAAVRGLIAALPSPIGASASSGAVTVTGAVSVGARVTTTGTLKQQAQYLEEIVQISAWAADGKQVREITDTLINNIGTELSPRVSIGDGTSALFRLQSTPKYRDDSQSDMNLYESHTLFACRYQRFQTSQLTQVGEVVETINLQPSNATLTVIGE